MPVKFTGKQFKDFWNSPWGPDACIEDELITVDGDEFDAGERGIDQIPDTARVVITGGVITLDQNNVRDWGIDAEPFARKWIKAQTTVTLMLEIDRADVDHWQDYIAAGIKRSGYKAKVIGP